MRAVPLPGGCGSCIYIGDSGTGEGIRTVGLRITRSRFPVPWRHLPSRNVRFSWRFEGFGRPLSPAVTPCHLWRGCRVVAGGSVDMVSARVRVAA